MFESFSFLRLTNLVIHLFQAKCLFYYIAFDRRNLNTFSVFNSITFILCSATPQGQNPKMIVTLLVNQFIDILYYLWSLDTEYQPIYSGSNANYYLINMLAMGVQLCRFLAAKVEIDWNFFFFFLKANSYLYTARLLAFLLLNGGAIPKLNVVQSLSAIFLLSNLCAFAFFCLDLVEKLTRVLERGTRMKTH